MWFHFLSLLSFRFQYGLPSLLWFTRWAGAPSCPASRGNLHHLHHRHDPSLAIDALGFPGAGCGLFTTSGLAPVTATFRGDARVTAARSSGVDGSRELHAVYRGFCCRLPYRRTAGYGKQGACGDARCRYSSDLGGYSALGSSGPAGTTFPTASHTSHAGPACFLPADRLRPISRPRTRSAVPFLPRRAPAFLAPACILRTLPPVYRRLRILAHLHTHTTWPPYLDHRVHLGVGFLTAAAHNHPAPLFFC